MTWRLLLAAVEEAKNPLVTIITDDSPPPGSLARRRAIHPALDGGTCGVRLTDERLDELRRGWCMEFTRFQTWQGYEEALAEDGEALRELRAALYGDATRYRPDLMVPPDDPEERPVWEVERAHALRLSQILEQVALFGRQLPETLYTNDLYNLAYSVPWHPERSRGADDIRALEALRERARHAGISRPPGSGAQGNLAGRVRYDAMVEAAVLVLGTYDQTVAHRFGSRRGDRKERIEPAKLLWFDRWLWFAQSVRRATVAVLLERPYPAPYGSGSAADGHIEPVVAMDGLRAAVADGDAGGGEADLDGLFARLALDIEDERLRKVVDRLSARERAVVSATAAGYSSKETATLLARSGVWIGATPGAIDTCRHRLRAKARRATGQATPPRPSDTNPGQR